LINGVSFCIGNTQFHGRMEQFCPKNRKFDRKTA
jgi:hypothetical protein